MKNVSGYVVNDNSHVDDLDEDVTNRVVEFLILVVSPTVSILGLFGNVLSIIVLKKHGLKKCSDILLFGLAISDILFLIGVNINCIGRLVHDTGHVIGFAMPYASAYFMYILLYIADVLDWGAGGVSFTVPVLITIERLVAVFLPLKYPTIITRTRTTIAMIVVNIFWYGLLIYTRIWFRFEYNNNNPYNVSTGRFERSDAYNREESEIIQGIVIYLTYKIPLPIVVVGCICIGVKVKLTSLKRAKMMSKSSENDKSAIQMSRTVKTLLSVCAVYSVACALCTIPQYMPKYVTYTMFADAPNNTARVLYQVMSSTLCINSSVNFIIYVVTNKKFRDTQKELFANCNPTK